MWEDGADTYMYLSIPTHTLFTQKPLQNSNKIE